LDPILPLFEQEATVTGEEALAWGAHLAGINFMAAVASFPGNEFIANLIEIGKFPKENLAWYSNGKSAIEAAFGAVLAGKKAAVSLRSSELGQTLDMLASLPLKNWPNGLLLFCVDDPGSWFTHNEMDSRAICVSIRIPVVEPKNIESAFSLPALAVDWSLKHEIPVLIRYSTSFAQEIAENIELENIQTKCSAKSHRWNKSIILSPKDVLESKVVWEHRLEKLSNDFSISGRNKLAGEGNIGILCSGYLSQKIVDIVDIEVNQIKIFSLETIHPLPKESIEYFFKDVDYVLVLEEGEPIVEKEVILLALEQEIKVKVSGKLDHTVPRAGELFRWQLEDILTQWFPDFESNAFYFPYQEQKDLSIQDGLCQSNLFEPVFDLLDDLFSSHFKDKTSILISNPDCTLRSQGKQNKKINISVSPGSSIGIASALSRQRPSAIVFALIGDTAFYHSGLNSLIDAIYHESNLIVIIFNNFMSVSSGLQPNPGSGENAKKRKTITASIEDILTGLPLNFYNVSLEDLEKLKETFLQVFSEEGIRVVHIKQSNDFS
jgi:indolepyruvate ferredoxin oxidoreductase, alpha subunit